MPEQWTISLGASAEKLGGSIHNISREAQDEFALRSHQNAQAAWESGFYGEWVVPVPDTELERDETIRPDTTLEKLSKLKAAFVKAARSPPAILRRSTTARVRPCSLTRKGPRQWAGSRSRGSSRGGRRESIPTCSGSRR